MRSKSALNRHRTKCIPLRCLSVCVFCLFYLTSFNAETLKQRPSRDVQDIGPIGADRNWKGIGISLLVILVVLSLIGMSIVLLSKGDVQQHPHLLLCGQLSLRQPLLTFSHSLDLCWCICAVCPNEGQSRVFPQWCVPGCDCLLGCCDSSPQTTVTNTQVQGWHWMTSSTRTSRYTIRMQSGSAVSARRIHHRLIFAPSATPTSPILCILRQ